MRWLIAISLCFSGGFFVLFTTWAPYDDEGYILWTLIHQSQSHILYDEIFTQYGPAFYWLDASLRNIIPFPRTTDGQRWQTLFFWLAIASTATIVLRNLVSNRFDNHSLSSSLFFTSSFGLIFWHLDRLAMEPGHPQNWCTLLTVGIYWLLNHSYSKSFHSFSVPQCVLLGTICGVLIMIKPNVGILAIAGLPASLLWIPRIRSHKFLKLTDWGYTTVICLLPWLIMHRQIGNANHWLHPLLVTTSLLLIRSEVYRTASLNPDSANKPTISFLSQRLMAMALGALLPILCFTLWALNQGSHLNQLGYAIFGQHQALMTLYYYPTFQTPIPWFSAIAALLLLLTIFRQPFAVFQRLGFINQLSVTDRGATLSTNISHDSPESTRNQTENHTLHLSVVMFITLGCLVWTIADSSTPLIHGLQPRGIASLLLAAMPWIVWIWIRNRSLTTPRITNKAAKQSTSISTSAATAKTPYIDYRLSLLTVIVMQTMIAFPVPGTQFSLGTLGLVIIALDLARTSIRDLIDATTLLTSTKSHLAIARGWSYALPVLLMLPMSVAAGRYFSREPLRLTGADLLRLAPENTLETLEIVNTLKELQVDTIVFQWHNRSSWLLWANCEPLSYAMPPSWPYLLNDQLQERSRERLQRATKVAVIDEDYGPRVQPRFSVLQEIWKQESQSIRRIGEFELKLWRPTHLPLRSKKEPNADRISRNQG